MSKFKLTNSQQVFVDSFNKNTLVSASAGSGKTSTMIAKLTDMVCKYSVPINKLLVVTYTNSAGNEMKQKLFNSLIKALNEETDEEKVSFISEQIDDMVNCDIGTLHAICKKIITNYFYVVEQDPSFSLLDGQQSDYLFDNAMNNVFNRLITQENEEFYLIYRLYNKKRNLNTLKYIIKTLHNYLLSKIDAKKWEDEVIKNCDYNNNKSKDYLIDYYKKLFVSFAEDFSKIKQKCVNNFEKYVNYVSDRLNFVLGVRDINNYEELFNFVNNYSFVSKPRVSLDNLREEEFDIIEKSEIVFKEFSDLLKNFKKYFVLMSEEDFVNYKKLIKKLFELQDLVNLEYLNLKKQQNALDFSDLEHITLKILENNFVVDSLKDKYDYIFIDEYQDINQVQEEIISRIKRDNNLYMIGDVKQSIYAFRLSSPEIFINKFNNFQNDGVKNHVINLNENFRSKENILQFSNLIFNKLITKNTVGVDYENNSQLVCGIEETFEKCVELNLIDEECETTEAQVIAKKVGEYIAKGYNYKDIAILLRSKGELVNEIYSELKKYNIPCEATYKTDLFKNSEVLVIYNLLKLVNYSYDDIAMASTLKSVLVGLNDNELAEIRLMNSELSFSECAYEYMLNGTNEHIILKLKQMIELINEIRFKLCAESIIEVVNYVLRKYDINNYYLSFVDGLEKISNINEFLRILKNEEYKYDLQKCIDYLDSIKKDGEVTLTLTGVGDSVKIMTMHSSKGLEYPVVIIGGFGKKFVLNKQTDDIIINDKLGVGVRMFDIDQHTQKESITKNACKLMNKKSEIDEEIRLLYVALTRPKKQLCIVGKYGITDVRRIASKSIYSSKSYLELLLKAMPNNVIQFFENKVDNFSLFDDEKYAFDVNFYKKQEELFDAEIKPIILNAPDIELANKVGEYFDYVYPHISSQNIAIKNTVSQILREEVDYENQVDSIVKNSSLDKYSMELGTAYHNIMQKLNYSEDLGDILELISENKSNDLPYKDIDPIKIFTAVKEVKKLMMSNTKILKEAQFVMKINYSEIDKLVDSEDMLVQGVIDLVVINDKEATIIDFKTNKTKNPKHLIDSYGIQLNLYALAFEKAYKIKVTKKLLYSFEIGKFFEV